VLTTSSIVSASPTTTCSKVLVLVAVTVVPWSSAVLTVRAERTVTTPGMDVPPASATTTARSASTSLDIVMPGCSLCLAGSCSRLSTTTG
jgi:hypothetical protein